MTREQWEKKTEKQRRVFVAKLAGWERGPHQETWAFAMTMAEE